MAIRPAPDYASGMWAHIFAPRAAGEQRSWLVKSEPDVFAWEDLLAAPGRTTHWNGVRNFSARNFMLDGMQLGDRVFYYHSSATPQAIMGIAEVARLAYPDPTQFDRAHEGFDPDAKREAPMWWMVDVRAVAPLPRPVTLAEIKATPALAQIALLRVGRLSVVPVSPTEWEAILAMAARPSAPAPTKASPRKETTAPRKSPAQKKTSASLKKK